MLQTLVDAYDIFKKDMKKISDKISDERMLETGQLKLTLTTNQEEPKNILSQHPGDNCSSNNVHLDQYELQLIIDSLQRSVIIDSTAALETFFSQIKKQFTQLLDIIYEFDKEFFKNYLRYDKTTVDRKELWSKVSEKLTSDTQSENSKDLTQMIMFTQTGIKPTAHDFYETIVNFIIKIKQSIEQSHTSELHIGASKSQLSSNLSNITNSYISPSTKLHTSYIKNKLTTMAITKNQQVSWQIWTQKEGKTYVHKVKTTSYHGLVHQSNLFYGIRCVFAHGEIEHTILSENYAPQNACDFDIEVTSTNQRNESHSSIKKWCEQHLFNLRNEAREKRHQMNVDYCLLRTMHSFYMYLAAWMHTICACVACDLCDKQLHGEGLQLGGQNIQEIRRLLQITDREQRANNIIIYNIAEPAGASEEDRQFCMNLFNKVLGVKIEENDINTVERLGKSRYSADKPRPVRVQFRDTDLKNKIMHTESLSKLKYAEPIYKQVRFAHDMNREDREEWKILVAEAKKKQSEDQSGEYIYRVKGTPGNFRIVQIRKRNYSSVMY